jgi:hypothetical protein
MATGSHAVWTPSDFADLANRAAVDKRSNALQRLVISVALIGVSTTARPRTDLRPAMRVVQALHWLQDLLADEDERTRIVRQLRRLFADPTHGQSIRDDLREGLSALPIWMQEFLRDLIGPGEGAT